MIFEQCEIPMPSKKNSSYFHDLTILTKKDDRDADNGN